jgi:hypothetical protein
MLDKDEREFRAIEDHLDPVAEARRVADGDWSPTDTPEDARELLDTVSRIERGHRLVGDLRAEKKADKAARHDKRARRHEARAKELAPIRRKLRNSAKGHARRASELVSGREDEHLPDADFRAFNNATTRLIAERDLDAQLAKLQRRHKKAAAKEHRAAVVNEPAPYTKKGPHSWFLDRIAHANPELGGFIAARGNFGDMSPQAVAERQGQHERDVRRALLKGDKYGRRIEALLREMHRQEDPSLHERKYLEGRSLWQRQELRTFTTGGGATASAAGGGAAAFVAPAFVLSAFAPFRSLGRVFADQCGTAEMPPFGMSIYIPAFTSGTVASQQVEGSGVSDATPTTFLQGSQVQTVSGEVAITQQLHDRGYTGGGSFDLVIAKQLGQQLAEKVDLFCLNQVIAGGAAVSGASSWAPATQGIAPLYTDIAKGREVLTDTAGVRLRPTHFFSTSDFYSYTTRQVDATTFRPWVVPSFAPGFPIATGADDGLQSDQIKPKWSRFTGTVLPGGVLWFTDDVIPATGSNTQLIVSAPDESVVIVEGDPVLSVYPETFATSLTALATLRSYVAVITRHAQGTAVITGNAYTTSLI